MMALHLLKWLLPEEAGAHIIVQTAGTGLRI